MEKAPFKIASIQVDDGSEFMADFEKACAELEIQLFVLPPKRPQWNGGVELGNRTFREEFCGRNDILEDSLGEIRARLKEALHIYNNYRPHQNLKNLTPMDYIQNLSRTTPQSHSVWTITFPGGIIDK